LSSRRVLAALTALPACIVALIGMWALLINPAGGWVWPPDEVNISEAVATGDYAEVARQIEAGVDPNPPMVVRAGLLGSKPSRLTPLQTAVWGRNSLMVKLLLDHGAIVAPTMLATLKCINAESPSEDVRAILDGLPVTSAPPAASCSELPIPR
jgi:hypothetical protein